MYALRASSSSAWRTATRRPFLAALASRYVQNPPQQVVDESVGNVANFLEQGDETGPTPFEVEDGPPMPVRGIGKREANAIPLANLPKFRLHCHASRNNTITTFTKEDGSTIAWASGGKEKFKKSNRASYEAGYKCATTMFAVMSKYYGDVEPFRLELFFKGFGEGREAMKTALLGVEGDFIRSLVIRVTDRTPLKIGGTRSKKTRRV